MGYRNPDEVTEFECHADAFIRLKQVYRNVRGEYHFRKDSRKVRFDIAILDDDKQVLLVIEVKNKKSHRDNSQYGRYGSITGKPVMYLRGEAQCREAVSMVKQWLKESGRGTDYLLMF